MDAKKDFNNLALRIMLISNGVCTTVPQSEDIADVIELKIGLCASPQDKLKKLSGALETEGFHWKKAVKCFYCATKINDFVSDLGKLKKDISFSDILAPGSQTNPIRVDADEEFFKFDSVQIVGVHDVYTGLFLLSRYKFDMIVLDWDANAHDAITFFGFLSKKSDELSGNLQLSKFQRDILNNRGPLNRLWVMPVSSDLSKVISDLQNNNIPFAHTRWYLDIGANLDETDLFRKRLDLLIGMQLKGCVFGMDELIRFLTFSGQHLQQAGDQKKGKTWQFNDFQDFMGAEFSTFTHHFGSRPIIRRDAYDKNASAQDPSQKSLFATSVWKSFYSPENVQSSQKDDQYLFVLLKYMQRFYLVAATMPEDRNGVLRLREAFRRMRYFIEINNLYIKKEGKIEQDKKNNLGKSMEYIADCIDTLLNSKQEKQNNTTI